MGGSKAARAFQPARRNWARGVLEGGGDHRQAIPVSWARPFLIAPLGGRRRSSASFGGEREKEEWLKTLKTWVASWPTWRVQYETLFLVPVAATAGHEGGAFSLSVSWLQLSDMPVMLPMNDQGGTGMEIYVAAAIASV
ncbi:hypothetical protein LX36DRAFT_661182 [Colletotrichum falcatum]|nr:hypothetical protein LX36DRAFT_661182 [Colletotrichum falcatum]